MNNEKLVYTVPEVASLLGLSRPTAFKLVHSGAIPCIKLGERRLVVPKVALTRMLDEAGKPKQS